MIQKNNNLSLKAMLVMAGAFISYTVGAGFASGNEVLQFFGSWGFPKVIIGLVAATIVTVIFLYSLFRASQYVDFDKTSDTYTFFGGKIFGTFYKYYVFVLITCNFMLMFSGAGSLLNQIWGLPQWVGSIIMGAIAGVVVLGGLKTVENVLGYAGIIILAYVAIFGIVSIIGHTSSLDQSLMYKAVQDGQILQTNLFQYPPFSWLPDALQHNNALFAGLLYGTLNLVSGFPFYFTLGKKTKTKKDASRSAVITAVAFYLCVALVAVIVVFNFDKIINPATGKMFPFPALSVIDAFWPSGSWTYALIIFTGIFTTVAGFLWVLTDWIFPGKGGSVQSKIFIAGMIVVGITLGGILPFSKVINIVFPISGFVGMIMTVILLVKAIKGYDKYDNKNKPIEEKPELTEAEASNDISQ